jgi:oligosaccharide 4-alpha-D-glucosyltransferase
VHSDAGGFAGGEGDNELYVRWLQFAAFTPIFRPHGTALYEVDTAAFSFPSEAALMEQPFRTYAREAIRLRYRFLPYNYSLAYAQTKWGKPLMAPLYYYFPDDTSAMRIEDEYMWGEELLAAPVLEKAATEKKLYLPAGNWWGFYSNKEYAGAQWIDAPVSLRTIPLFVRAGSFLPLLSTKINNTKEYLHTGVSLIYYPAAIKSQYTWYNDDGYSKTALAKKNYSLILCTGQDKGSQIEISLRASNKTFVSDSLLIRVVGLAAKPAAVIVNGRIVPVRDGDRDRATRHSNVALWFSGESVLHIFARFGAARKMEIRIRK